MTSEPNSSSSIAETAARWLARRDRGLTLQEQRDFEAWRAADPRHAEEWASFSDTWKVLGTASGVPDLVAEAAELEQRTRPVPRSSRWVGWALPGLAAAAALAFGFFIWQKSVPQSGPGAAPAMVLVAAEAKRLPLPDGSVVESRGDSEVTVDFSGPMRRLRLVRGEAFFTVAHDAIRPFIVEADGVAVRAVGTAFNVRRESGRIDVMVTEGRVRVANSPAVVIDTAPLVEAGTGARISAAANDPVETRILNPAELDGALAWRSPMLEFSRAPLEQVLAAFRQHAPHRVRLGEPALARRMISGPFQADNIEGFLRLAEKSLGLRVERATDGDIILHAAP